MGKYEELNVMIVDNDDLQLELVSAQLENLGVVNIVTADGGRSALTKFGAGQTKLDLLICDIQMPDMDGFDFIKAINERNFKGGIVLMSGQPPHVLRAAALVAQLSSTTFLGTISKPVTKSALEAVIEKMRSTSD